MHVERERESMCEAERALDKALETVTEGEYQGLSELLLEVLLRFLVFCVCRHTAPQLS